MARFFGELLTVRTLPSKGKDPALFPLFSSALAASMLEETHRLVDDVVFERPGSVLRLFDSDYTFVDDRLAVLYGMAPVAPGQWVQRELPPERRVAESPRDAEDCRLAESPIYMPDGRTQTRFVRVCRDASGKYAVVD